MAEISPILNNPYEEPLYHYATDIDGNLDYTKRLDGRRAYGSNVNLGSKQVQNTLFTGDDIETDDPNANFINSIREEVKKWRNNNYPYTTRITKELLLYWFCNKERPFHLQLFFCQREAVETAIYLNEVADKDPNTGRYILKQLEDRYSSVSSDIKYILPRTAFKMATGTGKTVVMAMLILYNYLNKKEYNQDKRFADCFLLVTPGITIKERLGVLKLDESNNRSYDKNDYYHQRGLIPPQYEKLLGGLNSSIVITNYHQFEPKVYTGKKASPLDGKLVYNTETKKMEKQTDKEEYTSVLSRILGKQLRSKRIIVINDEAHHCYLPKSDKNSKEATTENENAMVWYEGLRQMKLLGYNLQHIYDLSATPYYISGSGYPEYSLFPWVVSDFGLVDSIESGLVKIPFLPTMDSSVGLDEPVLRNIYERIKDNLPKKGQKKKGDEEDDTKEIKAERAPQLPSTLSLALDQFVVDYQNYEKGIREGGEEAMSLLTTPPVFIVVCNNTTVSKEVYKHIAGYETVDSEGNKVYIEGHYPIFSNYQNNLPKHKSPTLLVDSAVIDEANTQISEDFKKVFRDEISNFKREYASLHGAGAADQLTEEQILREVVNTVGKPNKLGAHVRCVVSVSMLTEGWDANTVTHVCGIRAFGSQLLCEQVAGRALRRRSYELMAYDARTGEEIAPENLRRYKDENVVYKFPPEYAHIIGVPFKNFKGGTSTPPPTPKPKYHIYAMEERAKYEMKFPNVVGYRTESIDGKIYADFTDCPNFRLDFNETPLQTLLTPVIGGKDVILDTNYEDLRDAQVIYYLTKQLISIKYSEDGPQFQKFSKLKAVVEKWYNEKIEIIGGNGDPNLRRLVIHWKAENIIESIARGIHSENDSEERVIGILDYYNPTITSADINGFTTKKVQETIKSHVNLMVADTDSWEQKAAGCLERMPEVICYVKNHLLNFKIPYVLENQQHNYITDFIARVSTPSGEIVNLMVEISGSSDDITGHKDIKRYYTTNFWLPAVNNMNTFGRWDFIEITDINSVEAQLRKKIQSL